MCEAWLSLAVVGLVRTKITPDVNLEDRDGRIRCPKCAWEPQRDDRWCCNPGGCGHVWNTFDTRGRCPSCDRYWRDTACLRCAQWSPHEEWYL